MQFPGGMDVDPQLSWLQYILVTMLCVVSLCVGAHTTYFAPQGRTCHETLLEISALQVWQFSRTLRYIKGMVKQCFESTPINRHTETHQV